mmetsp:Transcript_35309/g.69263  ORF Transcript_35309/g.69263 Transcript_35309/m.69263 type:complete len:211 (-) Transcript_35309:5102-5734(-)
MKPFASSNTQILGSAFRCICAPKSQTLQRGRSTTQKTKSSECALYLFTKCVTRTFITFGSHLTLLRKRPANTLNLLRVSLQATTARCGSSCSGTKVRHLREDFQKGQHGCSKLTCCLPMQSAGRKIRPPSACCLQILLTRSASMYGLPGVTICLLSTSRRKNGSCRNSEETQLPLPSVWLRLGKIVKRRTIPLIPYCPRFNGNLFQKKST